MIRLRKVIQIRQQTGHSTMAVTENGKKDGVLVGILTSRDFRETRVDLDNTKVKDVMTPYDKLIVGDEGLTLGRSERHHLGQETEPAADRRQGFVA